MITHTTNKTLLNEDRCWQAVLQRDPSFDTPFFYAVRSTGIYCRPSCPARRPRREQVVFFADTADAELAGFRACRRCRPCQAADSSRGMADVCRYIEAHLSDPLTLATLGSVAGLSPQHFQRVFRRVVGVTPRRYLAACRAAEFRDRLQENEAVTSALIEAGYGSTSRLYEHAPLGMTPTAYKRGGDVRVVYATADTALGRMLVAATAQGLCAVALGDSDDALEANLRREYPAAQIARDAGQLSEWVETLLGHLDGKQPALDLPLDIRATAFQQRVWQELQRTPYGETRSYTQVAAAIGRPTAARAVAQACASNPVALAVPCHRVVRGDGSLSGYRWGQERKQALLAREKAAARASGNAAQETEPPASNTSLN